ncbi:MAG TPA: cytochrome b/b6 domain-containing protein [Burkholderiales bacterium]
MTPEKYHPALVALHWLLAALVVFMLVMGMVSLEEIPNSSPDKLFALRGHMVIGVAILVLMLVRLVVRFSTRRPPAATTGHPLLDRAAALAHHGLYALVILMAASGFATALAAGLPDIVFGGSGKALPESFAAYPARTVHGIVGSLLAFLVLVHIIAALWHHFVRRDGLLRRMSFSRVR